MSEEQIAFPIYCPSRHVVAARIGTIEHRHLLRAFLLHRLAGVLNDLFKQPHNVFGVGEGFFDVYADELA